MVDDERRGTHLVRVRGGARAPTRARSGGPRAIADESPSATATDGARRHAQRAAMARPPKQKRVSAPHAARVGLSLNACARGQPRERAPAPPRRAGPTQPPAALAAARGPPVRGAESGAKGRPALRSCIPPSDAVHSLEHWPSLTRALVPGRRPIGARRRERGSLRGRDAEGRLRSRGVGRGARGAAGRLQQRVLRALRR